MPTIHVLVKGKVQGVFYRASAKEKAEALRLSGWVKNTAEGDVEAVVTGDTKAIQDFTDWCKKGPANASVVSVTISDVKDQAFNDFRIIK